MALSAKDIKGRYPLPVYNYRVTIMSGEDNQDEAGTSTFNISFSEVSGLTIGYEKVEYRHGRSFQQGVMLLPGIQQTHQITLTRGVTKSGRFLYDWIHHGSEKGLFRPVKRDIVIDLCDEEGAPLIRWHLFGALPLKLNAPHFNAASGEVAIESLELTARKLSVVFEL